MTTSSWYRRSLWSYKGNREYTRNGFEAASVRFVENDLDVDCSERHYMITGCSRGIGLATALEVAKRGGVIHMVCRNEEAAKEARSEIITTTGNDKIHLHILDLSKPRDVIVFAQRFAAQHEKLNVLINNAGCMVHERRLDEDDVETNFAVNTLAVHILTLTMLPLLQNNEDPRVVTVSSAGLLCVRLDPHDLMHTNMEPFDGRLVYSQNKRQQVVMMLWYAQRYNKVHFSSMHPGWADTAAVRTSLPEFYDMMKDNLRMPAQGADTVVWLAVSKAAMKYPSGLFFQDREPVPSHLPLAWTKSSIEEEDVFMNNMQNIYIQIHTKIFPPLPPSDAPPAPPSTEPSPTEALSTLQTQEPNTSYPLESPSSTQPQESSASQFSEDISSTQPPYSDGSSKPREELLKTPQNPASPPTFPILPPPPPPADKVTFKKSEVQEAAEVHLPSPTTVTKISEPPSVDTSQDKVTDAMTGPDISAMPLSAARQKDDENSDGEDGKNDSEKDGGDDNDSENNSADGIGDDNDGYASSTSSIEPDTTSAPPDEY